MNEEKQEVVLVVSTEGLQDKEKFEKQLKREGFSPIPNEPFTYLGETTTHKINTVLYIHSAVHRALSKAGFEQCKIIFQIGEYPMEAYQYDLENREFTGIDI